VKKFEKHTQVCQKIEKVGTSWSKHRKGWKQLVNNLKKFEKNGQTIEQGGKS